MKLAWMKWKQLTGVVFVMEQSVHCWMVRKKDENRLHVAEMRLLLCKTRKDHVSNQVIEEEAKVCQMPTFLRQKRLNWYGHIRRREEDKPSRKMMGMVVPGKRRIVDLDRDGSTTLGKIISDII